MATELAMLSRILLIDDDPISRDVLAMMLEMHGIAIDTAEDGEHALALLDKAQENELPPLDLPIVILMDTQMPGLSGLDLIAALRQRSRARIISISGSEVAPAIRQATDGFLLKPIQIEALVILLEAAPSPAPAGLENQITPTNPTASPATQPNSSSSATSLIDPLVLGKFKAMMGRPAVLEIYTAAAEDLKPRLDRLSAAMDLGNEDEVRRISHSIKGGCAMVGLTAAANAAASLEISNGPETYFAQLAELHSSLRELEGILKDDLNI